MRLTRKKTGEDNDYKLENENLEYVKTIKDLGTTVNYDVSWGTHITENTAKANRTLELVKRVCRDLEDITIRKYLYISLVRSQLEYFFELWSPSEIKSKHVLDSYINNNIWHLHSLSVDESQSLCRKFDCRKDIHYKTQTGTSCEKCNSKAFRLGIY